MTPRAAAGRRSPPAEGGLLRLGLVGPARDEDRAAFVELAERRQVVALRDGLEDVVAAPVVELAEERPSIETGARVPCDEARSSATGRSCSRRGAACVRCGRRLLSAPPSAPPGRHRETAAGAVDRSRPVAVDVVAFAAEPATQPEDSRVGFHTHDGGGAAVRQGVAHALRRGVLVPEDVGVGPHRAEVRRAARGHRLAEERGVRGRSNWGRMGQISTREAAERFSLRAH